MQYFVCACSAMAKDSLAQSIGSGGELLRLARVVGRQDLEVLLDRRHDASRCAWAGLGAEPSRIATARALGLDAHAPEGITMPDRYDPLSGQPWCRNRLAYLLHDIAVGAAERRDAVCAETGLTS